jgi:hypothetical protein
VLIELKTLRADRHPGQQPQPRRSRQPVTRLFPPLPARTRHRPLAASRVTVRRPGSVHCSFNFRSVGGSPEAGGHPLFAGREQAELLRCLSRRARPGPGSELNGSVGRLRFGLRGGHRLSDVMVSAPWEVRRVHAPAGTVMCTPRRPNGQDR